MTRTARVILSAAVAAVAGWAIVITATVSTATAQDLKFPQGFDASKPAAIKKPKSIFAWKVVVARDALPVLAGPDGDEARKVPTKLGEVLYVSAVQETPGKPKRLLVGRFNKDGAEFAEWVGWVDECYLLDERRPLEVKATRDYLKSVMPADHPFAKKLSTALPDASKEDYGSVTLKAVTHPERGKACFPRPVTPEEYDAASKTDSAVALQPFAFFYVYKIAVEPKSVYCLLGPRSETAPLEEGRFGDKFREQLVGWVDIDSLVLWTTREAFEADLRKPNLEFRRKAARPIELYARDADLKDYANWELGGRKDKNPAEPIFSEELEDAKAPRDWRQPWPPNWMRYPILASYPLQGQGAPPAGITTDKWMGYQLCVLGNTDKGAGGVGGAADVEELKKKLNDAVAQLRVFELVIVIDTTGSMDPVFEPVKEGMKELVKELKKRAASEKDELEKIQLKVAVVLYKDFPREDSEYLTRDSEDYFDVMAPAGLEAFETWLSAVKAGGGGDELEEPFEGIDVAVRKFLTPQSGSKHANGAAPVITIFGDVGNHNKGSGMTRLDLNDVLRSLDPVGTDKVGGQQKKVAKIQLHSVRTIVAGADTDGARAWDGQLAELAKQSGGTANVVDFKSGSRDEQFNKVKGALIAAVDGRRDLMRKELERIRNDVIKTGGGTAGGSSSGVSGASVVIAEDRLKQVLGEAELKRIREGLAKAYFSIVHAVEQIPGESDRLARLRLCILMTEQEFLKVQTACQILGEGLVEEISKGGLSGDKVEAKIKELLIKTMLSAFGETVTAGRVADLMKKSLPEIQRETNKLPVQFGVLKTLPKDEDGLKKMAEELQIKAGKLLEVVGTARHRFFPAGVATGENHIWVYKEELP